MSDEDRDVDIESDEEDEDGGGYAGLGDEASPGTDGSGQFLTQAEKRAHHNALERKRRDHIKESFHSLRDSVPALQGEKVSARITHSPVTSKVSRAQILKKAADYIQYMRRKNHTHQQDIDDLKKQNTVLEQQIRALEKAKSTGQFAAQSSSALNPKGTVMSAFDGGSGSESSETEGLSPSRRKKMKTSS